MNQSSLTTIDEILAYQSYHLRLRHYQHAITKHCENPNHGPIEFWNIFALGMTQQFSIALSHLQTFRSTHSELEYSILVLEYELSRVGKEKDDDDLQSMEMITLALEDTADSKNWIMTARLYLYVRNLSQMKKILTRIDQAGNLTSSERFEVVCLKVWSIHLAAVQKEESYSSLNETVPKDSNKLHFEEDLEAILKDSQGIESYLALSKLHEMKQNSEQSLKYVQNVISLCPKFVPAQMEKCRIHLKRSNWKQALDTIALATRTKTHLENMDVLIMAISVECLVKGPSKRLNEYIDLLLGQVKLPEFFLDKDLALHLCRFFSRIGGNNSSIHAACLKLLSLARSDSDSDSRIFEELGFLLRVKGDFKKALKSYERAVVADNSNMSAQFGAMRCHMELGSLEDVEQQIEFLSAISGDDTKFSKSSEYLLIQATLHRKKHRSELKHPRLLSEAKDLHDALQERVQNSYNGILQSFIVFDLDFVNHLAGEFLVYLDEVDNLSNSLEKNEFMGPNYEYVDKGLQLLNEITMKIPGDTNSLLLLSKVCIELKRFETAMKYIERCHKTHAEGEAHLLSAYIHVQKLDFMAAKQELDSALSHDFRLRKNPLYSLTKSECLLHEKMINEAQQILQKSIDGYTNDDTQGLINHDPVSTKYVLLSFVKLASVSIDLELFDLAENVLSKATSLFKNTSNEPRLIIAHSKLVLSQHNVTQALQLLNQVPLYSNSFPAVQVVKADIFWDKLHDKKSYLQVHKNLVKSKPSCYSFILLGEAYMRMQCFDQAIKAFEKAMHIGPKNNKLKEKIGKVLVSTHKYEKALKYYRNMLQTDPSNAPIRNALVHLYMKMKQYDVAETLIISRLNQYNSFQSDDEKNNHVKMIMQLTHILKLSHKYESIKSFLNQAKEIQESLIEKQEDKSSSDFNRNLNILTQIHFELGQCAERDHKQNDSISRYEATLQIDATHYDSILALAKIYQSLKNFDKCQEYCNLLTRIKPNTGDGMIIAGDMKFFQSKYDEAIHIYEKLLTIKPNNFIVLEKAMILFRRAGRLSDIPALLREAEKHGKTTTSANGFTFCKGLYRRFTNDINGAILHFNQARHDIVWGTKSLQNMVELYLNPNRNDLQKIEINTTQKKKHIKVIDQLLTELSARDSDAVQLEILQTRFNLVMKSKELTISNAIRAFQAIIDKDKEQVSAYFGLANAYMMESSVNKARNTLKRMAKIPYNIEFGDDFERCYLHLAESYILRDKFDLAVDLCKRCLVFNKSCSPAWETIGDIMGKQYDFESASECYEKCWDIETSISASIGYKLAYSYMKGDHTIASLGICQKVLKEFPDFNKIKVDIMTKCVSELRP